MLRARFDRIFTKKTGYVMLDRLLARLHARKAELLRVLDRPDIPLHTNGSENDIRSVVTKRKISVSIRRRPSGVTLSRARSSDQAACMIAMVCPVGIQFQGSSSSMRVCG